MDKQKSREDALEDLEKGLRKFTKIRDIMMVAIAVTNEDGQTNYYNQKHFVMVEADGSALKRAEKNEKDKQAMVHKCNIYNEDEYELAKSLHDDYSIQVIEIKREMRSRLDQHPEKKSEFMPILRKIPRVTHYTDLDERMLESEELYEKILNQQKPVVKVNVENNNAAETEEVLRGEEVENEK